MGNIVTKKLKSMNSKHATLDLDTDAKPEDWVGMPVYKNMNILNDGYLINMRFRTLQDMQDFAKALNMPSIGVPGKKIKTVWWPALEEGERGNNVLLGYMDESDPAISHLLD